MSETIRHNLRVDWTQAAVKRVLRKRKVRREDLEWFLTQVMEQAKASYADWPVAA